MFSDISGLYLSMLARAVAFALAQSCASVIVATLAALIIAFSVLRAPARWQRRYLESLRLVGLVIFFAPSLVAALAYLKWTEILTWLPNFGWVPIVLVHAALNVLFLAHAFAAVMIQESEAGHRLFEVAQVFRISKWRFYYHALAVPLRREMLRWWPLIFWWSFSSFTTVLVLGGGPKYSTPEVLLFYLVGAGDRPARVWLLSLLQMALGLLALRWARRHRGELSVPGAPLEVPPLMAPALGTGEKLLRTIGVVLATLAALFWLPALVQALRSLGTTFAWAQAAAPLGISISIVWRALVIGAVLVALGTWMRSKVSHRVSDALVISPMVWVALVTPSEWFLSTTLSARLWLSAALCVWSTLPMLALWVYSRREELDARARDTQTVFRAGAWYRWRFWIAPFLLMPVVSYFQILLLAVLGDVGIVSAILGSTSPALSQTVYAQISAYRFDVAFTLFGYLVLLTLPFWGVLVWLRRRYEESR